MTTDQLFRIECVEWTGGQIGDNDSAEDMKNIDLSCVSASLPPDPYSPCNTVQGWE